jgi:hypothetical protein
VPKHGLRQRLLLDHLRDLERPDLRRLANRLQGPQGQDVGAEVDAALDLGELGLVELDASTDRSTDSRTLSSSRIVLSSIRVSLFSMILAWSRRTRASVIATAVSRSASSICATIWPARTGSPLSGSMGMMRPSMGIVIRYVRGSRVVARSSTNAVTRPRRAGAVSTSCDAVVDA